MMGSEMTLARYYARKAVKAQYQARGLRWQHIESSELSREADAYLRAHPELIAFSSERYRNFVESGALPRPRHPRKPHQ